MEDDSYLIIGMLPLTAMLLRVVFRGRVARWDYAGLGAAFTFMMLAKVTAAFLVFLIPLGFVVGRLINGRGVSYRAALATFFLLLSVVFGTSLINRALPVAREAQPGIDFQDSNIWEMLFASNGLHDAQNAMGLFKNGRERDQLAAELIEQETPREDIEDVRRLRHSALADELIHKPGVQQAWAERPGFFLNNALIRLWTHGALFYGYPDRGTYWRADRVLPGHNWAQDVTEEELRHGSGAMNTWVWRARYDEIWKIAPQLIVSSLFNWDAPSLRWLNIVALLAAFLGLLALRRPELMFIFGMSYVAKLAFNVAIHGKVRYFDFVHVPMMVGLALFIVGTYWALHASPLGANRTGRQG